MLLSYPYTLLAVGVTLSQPTYFPPKWRFSCADSHWLESPYCCNRLSAERTYGKCESNMADYPSASFCCGRPKSRLTKSVTVSEFVGKDEFYRDPYARRQERPACSDLDNDAVVCL
jgi:hypothetical protein